MSMWDFISINLLKSREQIEQLYTPKYYKYPIPLYVIVQLIVKKDIDFFDIYYFLIKIIYIIQIKVDVAPQKNLFFQCFL